MLREKSPGLKILWVWAIGTAGILVTTVVRTRMRDMEKFMNAEEQQPTITTTTTTTDSIIPDISPESEQVVAEDKS